MKHKQINRTIPALVEQTLAEHGVWNAVVFLLSAHRLRQSDYEAWRLGNIVCLEDAIFGNRQRILEMLDTAWRHAEHMGLLTTSMIWTGWGHQEGTPLRLFHDADENTRFQIQLTPKADRPQLDLFMDTPKTILLNRLRRALLERDPECDVLFERALDDMPNEPSLARLDVIRAAMQSHVIENARSRFKYLDEVIAPAVMDEFGSRGMDILAPMWRASAVALQDTPFEPAHPDQHASEAWLRAHAWEQCVEAIESVTDWSRYSALHERRIAAITGMHPHPEDVRHAWAEFCWLCPQDAAKALDTADLHSCGLHRLWQQFSLMEPVQPVDAFPAFMRIYGLHTSRQTTVSHEIQQTRGWQHDELLAGLISQEQKGNSDMGLRRRLKEANPSLLHAYMATVKSIPHS